MVAAKLVGSYELLLEGEGRLDGAVNTDRRGTASGEEGCGCRSEGEYFGWMGCLELMLALGWIAKRQREGGGGSSNLDPPCGR